MQLNLIEKQEYENNKNYIYRTLRKNIMDLILQPGEKISETELQLLFETSRSPIREALVKLEKENLVKIYPQKYTVISLIDLDLVDDILFMRTTLEKEVLSLAFQHTVERDLLLENLQENFKQMNRCLSGELDSEGLLQFFYLDNNFHELIFDYVGRKNIWHTLTFLGAHYERFRVLNVTEKENLVFTLEQHQRILSILQSNDKKLLPIIGQAHVHNFRNSFQRVLEKHPEFFQQNINDSIVNK